MRLVHDGLDSPLGFLHLNRTVSLAGGLGEGLLEHLPMQLEARRPAQKSQRDPPAHDLEEDEARAVSIVGAALVEQITGGLDGVKDNDGSPQHGEVEDVRVIVFAPLGV